MGELLVIAGTSIGKVAVALVVLGILVFVHELGHFLVAKWNGVGVVEFAIGFGKKIWSRHVGETRYSIGLIPLGGYVRMIGDDPFSLPQDHADELDQQQRQLLQQRDRWFLSKGYFAKMAIVLAGPAFNILFALLLSIGSIAWFGKVDTIDKAVIGDVIPGYPAAKSGLRANDEVIDINGKAPTTWVELADLIAHSGGRSLTLRVRRQETPTDEPREETIVVQGTLDTQDLAVLEGKETPDERFKIGIVPKVKREEAGFGEAFVYGTRQVYFISVMTVRGLWGMVRGVISTKNIGGPLLILQEAARTARKGVEYLVDFMILLSVSLAILNLLPIPILDGGHLVFFTLEAIMGGPLSLRIQERANQFGMLVLLMLMLFAVSNDLQRLLTSSP
jgi:regulator of sigma E protease